MPMLRCAGLLGKIAVSLLTASEPSVRTSPHDGDAIMDPLLTTLLGLHSQHLHRLLNAVDRPDIPKDVVPFT